MVSLTETTVTITAIVFIVILIILAKLSSQLDTQTTIMKQIIRKLIENEETNKWMVGLMRDKFEKIANKIEHAGEDIKWK
ncbi:MAG: hypothetical protein A2297_03900 [Elusimicrobia bacterium RIFOXYB2_FULL_48_7]|nr:MAG: hypothetical protein A2297_03900 [Elusimicrobia bacterium RIFOXYB2_FULL_48_7]